MPILTGLSNDPRKHGWRSGHAEHQEEKTMTDTTRGGSGEDLEHQFKVLREDFVTLTQLMKEIGESKAGESRDAALAEAAKLLERSQAALDEGRLRARQATASVEDYVREKPVQSALIALGVGFLVGLMARR
jgi:ElaB/YqjD/DUF883 family membrane-anchored ribosome-binding protein